MSVVRAIVLLLIIVAGGAFASLSIASEAESQPSDNPLLEDFENMPDSKAKDDYIAEIAGDWASLMGHAMRRCSRLRDEDAHLLLRVDEQGVINEAAGLTDNRVTACLIKTYLGEKLAPPPFQPFVMAFTLDI